MSTPLNRDIYYEELNEQAQLDIFNDIVEQIKKEFSDEFGNENDCNVKIKELYFFMNDEQVDNFINNLAVARIVERFKGIINY